VIVRTLRDAGLSRLLSVGVGTGHLEYVVKMASPRLRLRCGDFAPATVEALKSRFPESDEISLMDLTVTAWAGDPEEAVLLNRVDMELANAEWKRVFAAMSLAGTPLVLWVPCGLLTPLAVARQTRTALAAALTCRRLVPTGYLRTAASMRDLFRPSYHVAATEPAGELPIWRLER
jgi:hypothetical protein